MKSNQAGDIQSLPSILADLGLLACWVALKGKFRFESIPPHQVKRTCELQVKEKDKVNRKRASAATVYKTKMDRLKS